VSPEAETVVRGRERPTQKERGRERQRQMDRHGERQRGEAYRVRKTDAGPQRRSTDRETEAKKKKNERERERESVTTDGHRRETEISGSQSSRNDEPTGRNFLHV
jgi:hypothetical protein